MSTQQQPDEEGVVVCCSCFGAAGRRRKDEEQAAPGGAVAEDSTARRRSTIFQDCIQDGEQSDHFYYFDAEQEELDANDYPIITTTTVKRAPPRLSMLVPATLLRSAAADSDAEEITAAVVTPDEPPVTMNRRRSSFSQLLTHHQQKQQPHKVRVVERGYPGQLDSNELEEFLAFREAVRQRPVSNEIVYSYQDFEEEPYTLCRFLRPTKFSADKMLERLQQSEAGWLAAKEHDFYPDLEQSLGAPLPHFLQMYPLLTHGHAKNGCPCTYLQAGRIETEGILCLTTVSEAASFFWNYSVHLMPQCMKRAKARNPDLVRCEVVQTIDIGGISRAQFNAESLEVIKLASFVNDYFPETLHCLIVLNAPRWFSVVWALIKRLIDPRTAMKIEVYSSSARGTQRLLELVDESEVPSDFGGTGPSFESLIQAAAAVGGLGGGKNTKNDPVDNDSKDDNSKCESHPVELVDLKKSKRRKASVTLVDHLQEGESLSVHIYTRSITGCSVWVHCGDEKQLPVVKVKGAAQVVKSLEETSEKTSTSSPVRHKTEICSNVQAGGGAVVVHLEGDEASGVDNNNKNLPHGVFLITATVKK